jgi:hypothetical protein
MPNVARGVEILKQFSLHTRRLQACSVWGSLRSGAFGTVSANLLLDTIYANAREVITFAAYLRPQAHRALGRGASILTVAARNGQEQNYSSQHQQPSTVPTTIRKSTSVVEHVLYVSDYVSTRTE